MELGSASVKAFCCGGGAGILLKGVYLESGVDGARSVVRCL